MLAIQKYIYEHGLEKAVSDFKLVLKDYPHKVLLKYDQIESSMQHEEVRDCRGLVLDKKDYSVMSLGFRKFFNLGEGHAAKINWNDCVVYKKLDGTFIHLYWDQYLNRWEVGTTGTADGVTPVNNKPDMTFRDLFIDTFNRVSNFEAFEKVSSKRTVFIFELCTPFNIVVTPHSTCSIHLLGMRDLETMCELSHLEAVAKDICVPVAESYDLKRDPEFLKETLLDMPYSEEGYVVRDIHFNRVKIKNPAYLAVHHMADATAYWRIIDVVRSNEIEEYAATFVDRRDELFDLKSKYDALSEKMDEMYSKVESIEGRKEYALAVLEMCKNEKCKPFQSYFFGRRDGRINTIKQYLTEYDGKDLYKCLVK